MVSHFNRLSLFLIAILLMFMWAPHMTMGTSSLTTFFSSLAQSTCHFECWCMCHSNTPDLCAWGYHGLHVTIGLFHKHCVFFFIKIGFTEFFVYICCYDDRVFHSDFQKKILTGTKRKKSCFSEIYYPLPWRNVLWCHLLSLTVI